MNVNNTSSKKSLCVGIIMDGNRRWARQKGLPSVKGHQAGSETLNKCLYWAKEAGVTHLIAYAFSTENWKRSEEEVSYFLNLLRKFLKKDAKTYQKEEVCVRFIGNKGRFPQDIQELLHDIEEKTKNFTKAHLIIALSYGGRAELIEAFKKLTKNKTVEEMQNITEHDIQNSLFTTDIPDPDVIIRTGGEMRLSNFLPWQSTYSELFFTDTFWPDFSQEEFNDILDAFTKRERRIGR